MEFVDISELFDRLELYINEELLEKYGLEGSKRHLLVYLRANYPDKINVDSDPVLVSDEINNAEFIESYSKRNDDDFSALDCAYYILSRWGMPPIELMSPASLEKDIREVFISNESIREKVYIKQRILACVDRGTAREIGLLPEINEKVCAQIRKAQKKNDGSPAWRKWELEHAYMKSVSISENDSSDESVGYCNVPISEEEKRELDREMVKAIYHALFTEFDYAKLQQYKDARFDLLSAQEFGDDYQHFDDVLNSPNHNYEFYQVSPDSVLLDALADKIAEKLLEKMKKQKGE